MKRITFSFIISLISIVAIGQDKKQCAAIKKDNTQCRNNVKDSVAYCYQHNPAIAMCGANTSKNKPCTRKVREAGVKCWQHSESKNTKIQNISF